MEKDIIHLGSDEVFTPSLTLRDLKSIIMALAHATEQQINISDSQRMNLIFHLKYQIGDMVIRKYIDGQGVDSYID